MMLAKGYLMRGDSYEPIPPTPPCIDCKKKRLDGECYKWCDPWNEYAEKYQAFVKERDELKELRAREA